MILIEEIYSKAIEVLKGIKQLPLNEQELVLFYALRLLAHNALIAELEDMRQEGDSETRD